MSGSLAFAGALALTSVYLRTARAIGSIIPDVVVEENHSDSLVMTEHPVERGAPITDHAYRRPSEVTLHCSFQVGGLLGLVSSVVTALQSGTLDGLSQASAVYNELLALQRSRQPFSLTTGKRTYSNMLISELRVTTNRGTENILDVYVTCREIITVQAYSTVLPAAASQAMPSATAETLDTGVRQPQEVAPNTSFLRSGARVLGFN